MSNRVQTCTSTLFLGDMAGDMARTNRRKGPVKRQTGDGERAGKAPYMHG